MKAGVVNTNDLAAVDAQLREGRVVSWKSRPTDMIEHVGIERAKQFCVEVSLLNVPNIRGMCHLGGEWVSVVNSLDDFGYLSASELVS